MLELAVGRYLMILNQLGIKLLAYIKVNLNLIFLKFKFSIDKWITNQY